VDESAKISLDYHNLTQEARMMSRGSRPHQEEPIMPLPRANSAGGRPSWATQQDLPRGKANHTVDRAKESLAVLSALKRLPGHLVQELIIPAVIDVTSQQLGASLPPMMVTSLDEERELQRNQRAAAAAPWNHHHRSHEHDPHQPYEDEGGAGVSSGLQNLPIDHHRHLAHPSIQVGDEDNILLHDDIEGHRHHHHHNLEDHHPCSVPSSSVFKEGENNKNNNNVNNLTTTGLIGTQQQQQNNNKMNNNPSPIIIQQQQLPVRAYNGLSVGWGTSEDVTKQPGGASIRAYAFLEDRVCERVPPHRSPYEDLEDEE
jgi:hypothetical protein